MAIEKIFQNELKRLQLLPQRAIYTQLRQATSSSERKMMEAMTLNKQKTKVQSLARELLWFFGALLGGLFLGFIIFYFMGILLPQSFVQMANDWGVTKLYYLISLFCFVGIYLVRVTVWAIKTLTAAID